MFIRALLLIMLFFPLSANALTMEEGADAPTRTIEDYIKDYVDVPEGAIDWKTFGATKIINVETKDSDGLDFQYYKPEFTKDVLALDGQKIKIKGFMFPLDETEDQKFFLFGPFPLNCPFQYHVQSSLVLEVRTAKKAIPFTYDPLILAGTLQLVHEDKENSTFYRLLDAKIVD